MVPDEYYPTPSPLSARKPRWQSHWRNSADDVLAPLFADGRQPTVSELRDAYPFGERQYLPYKVWLQQVRWWRNGCPEGLRVDGQPPRSVRRTAEVPPEQAALL